MANTGVSPINPATPVGQFRLLLGDTDATDVAAGSGTYKYYSDTEITALVGLYNGSVKRAAARALLTIAASQALLLKSFTQDDLQVRGDAIAEALRKIAKDLNAEADADDEVSGASSYFDIVDTNTDPTWWGDYVEGVPFKVPVFPYGW